MKDEPRWPRPRPDPDREPVEPWARRDGPRFDWDRWRKEHDDADTEDDPEP